MTRLPQSDTRTDTLLPYTTLFRPVLALRGKRRREYLHLPPAARLGVIHSQIGVAHQRGQPPAVLAVEGDADGGPDLDRVARDLIGLGQCAQQPATKPSGVLGAGDIRHQDGELVPAEPCGKDRKSTRLNSSH